jgi:thiaminase/transcriptional activator TenA
VRLAQDLWQTNLDLARECLAHPFMRGIADGTLPRQRFAFYVGQDTCFLEAFARAYSIAAAKAPDGETLRTFHRLTGGVLEELRLHKGYAAAWGVDVRALSPAPATRHYTDFLLATAWQHEIGLTAVAMSPCMRLYAFLGQELARNGIPKHLYADWIRTYSSQAFDELAQLLERLVDSHASDTHLVRSTYAYAMRCERDFFQAAWEGEQDRR